VARPAVPRMVGAESNRLEGRLYQIHDHLDRLLDDADAGGGDPAARRRAAEALSEIASRLAPEGELVGADEGLLGTARELLSTDFYVRHWGRVAMRNRSEEVDDFGYDPTYDARVEPFFRFLFERWFRVRCTGLEHVPRQGLTAGHALKRPAARNIFQQALATSLLFDATPWWTTCLVIQQDRCAGVAVDPISTKSQRLVEIVDRDLAGNLCRHDVGEDSFAPFRRPCHFEVRHCLGGEQRFHTGPHETAAAGYPLG